MVRGKLRHLVGVALVLALGFAALAEDAPSKDSKDSKDKKVRLELRNAPLASVLRALVERTGKTLVLREEVPERVSLSFAEMRPDDALDQLLELHGYRKEVDGTRVIVTRRIAETAPVVTQTAPSDAPVGRVYVLARVAADEAVAALATATGGNASIDVLPGDRELLVIARPADHERVKAWLDDADRSRPTERRFHLANRTIAGVDSATAATRDPVAREVERLLSPAGSLAVDLGANALVVRDEPPVLERVAERIAALDRAPASVTLEVAAIEVPIGTPLPGYAPANDLPAAFASNANAGVMVCHAVEATDLDAIVTALTNNPDEVDVGVLRGRDGTKCEERRTMTFRMAHMADVGITPRLAAGGVDIEVHAGSAEARVRAPSGRPVALRGFVKTSKWTGGWSDEHSELVLFVLATADALPARSHREPSRRATPSRGPDLALPETWAPASAPK